MRIVKAMPQAPGMTLAEAEDFLAKQKTPMRLGTVDSDGDPQIHPVWYYFNSGRLYLMSDKSVRKIQNIKGKSTVYFSIDTDETPNKGVKGKGTAQIITEKADLARVYRAYWKTHPVFMLLGIGLRIWIEMLLGNRVVVRVDPDEPNPLAGVDEI